MQRIVLASSNPGKLAEIRDVLADTGIELVAQSEFGIADADETGTTFVENALIKARHAARQSGLPALGDDSGICVDVLGGAPGLYSARYAGEHGNNAANNAKLLEALRDLPDEKRSAHFHCTLVLLRSADDPAPLIAEGLWRGRICRRSRSTSTSRGACASVRTAISIRTTRRTRCRSASTSRRCSPISTAICHSRKAGRCAASSSAAARRACSRRTASLAFSTA